jgi:tetratricopeptide (TPR) repeat protein
VGNVYYKLGKYDDAETMYRKLVEFATQPLSENATEHEKHSRLPEDDMLILKSISNLAMLLKKMKRYDEAEVRSKTNLGWRYTAFNTTYRTLRITFHTSRHS